MSPPSRWSPAWPLLWAGSPFAYAKELLCLPRPLPAAVAFLPPALEGEAAAPGGLPGPEVGTPFEGSRSLHPLGVWREMLLTFSASSLLSLSSCVLSLSCPLSLPPSFLPSFSFLSSPSPPHSSPPLQDTPS